MRAGKTPPLRPKRALLAGVWEEGAALPCLRLFVASVLTSRLLSLCQPSKGGPLSVSCPGSDSKKWGREESRAGRKGRSLGKHTLPAGCSVASVSDSLRSCGLEPTRLLCPWDSPGKSAGVGCPPSSRASSPPRDRTGHSHVSCIGRVFTTSATWEARSHIRTVHMTSFPGGSAGKESACNEGDMDSIPGLGRSPGEGKATHSSILAWRIPWTA